MGKISVDDCFAYDIASLLESRSDGDCPYGRNLRLRLFRLRHCESIGKSFGWRLSLLAKSPFTTVSLTTLLSCSNHRMNSIGLGLVVCAMVTTHDPVSVGGGDGSG